MKTPSILLLTIAPIATVFGLNLSVTNTNDSGPGSLRQAILSANGSPGSVISFNIGNGVQTITPITQLPFVTAAVIIDGSTQPGFTSTPLIEISAATVSNNGNGLVIDSGAGGSTIRSLVINHGWNDGILLQASDCVVTGCFIGTDPTGTVAHGNTIGIATSFGVPATGNHIGGVTAAQRNLISGNSTGVLLNGGATDNLIIGNFIGTDATGDNALANSVGVDLRDSNNTVGGNTVSLRNTIAGAGSGTGVAVQPAGNATDNRIQGNFIGTDRTGTKALGFNNGVFLSSGATNTLVGGLATTPGTPPGNLISGNNNGGAGVEIALTVSNNSVQGNLIGTNSAGTAALANFDGIQIQGSSNLIGGNTTAARNVISGNARHGIFFGTNNTVVQDNLIQGNFIGTKINGAQLLGNASEGIFVVESIHNTIGGTVTVAGAPPGNLIAGNAGNGIGVSFGAFGVTGLTIEGNSISSNGGLGIDLGEDGVTPNDDGDADSGVNNLQNFPVLTSVTNSGGMTHISGRLNSTPGTNFRIEFFANDSIDSSSYGEGQTFIGFQDVMTGAGGNGNINKMFPQIGDGQRVTATATDPNGNTSEFSSAIGQLLNVSTRMEVLTGGSVLIGGFIIGGSGSKDVLLRALGPTLANFGVTGFVADPTLDLFDGSGNPLKSNDNWKSSQEADIMNTGKAPPNDLEPAIRQSLAPGSYTAIVRGKNNTTGIGLVEAYDLDNLATITLTNISTRGFVDINQNVMIGGFISGDGIVRVIVRALGPTLAQFGVPNVLADPVLDVRDAQGNSLATNDNWKDTQQAEIQASGKAPPNDNESAIIIVRPAANTTAIVTGKNNTTGNALVEAYILPP
jgi:hypothetical protein